MQNVSTAPNNNVQSVKSNLNNSNNQVNNQSSTQMRMQGKISNQNNKPVQNNQSSLNSKNNFNTAIKIGQNGNIDFERERQHQFFH